MLFQNGKLKVRKLEKKDNYLLAKWLQDPIVLEFYEGRDNAFNLERVNKEYFSLEDATVKCIVEYGEKEIGYIQFYQLDDVTKEKYGYLNESVYGTDQFIGEVKYWNRGIGTLLVTSMVKYLTLHKKADLVVMDPQIRNARAIHCYEKCGFTKIKLLPNHELHEGEYQDCWLIEWRENK